MVAGWAGGTLTFGVVWSHSPYLFLYHQTEIPEVIFIPWDWISSRSGFWPPSPIQVAIETFGTICNNDYLGVEKVAGTHLFFAPPSQAGGYWVPLFSPGASFSTSIFSTAAFQGEGFGFILFWIWGARSSQCSEDTPGTAWWGPCREDWTSVSHMQGQCWLSCPVVLCSCLPGSQFILLSPSGV